jgi:enoyl-CoA hydratase/carnithine racemase
MNNHIMQKIGDFWHKKLALLGHKFEPKESLEAKIVDRLVPSDLLITEAVKMAREIKEKGRHRKAYKAIKEVLYEKVIEDCLYRGVNPASRTFMPNPGQSIKPKL